MQPLLTPFKNPAKINFDKLVPEKPPSGAQGMAIILDKESLEGDVPYLSWLKPYLKESLIADLKKKKHAWVYPENIDVKQVLLIPVLNKGGSKVIKAIGKLVVKLLKVKNMKDPIIAFGEFKASEVGQCLNTMIIENTEQTKKKTKGKGCIEVLNVHLHEELHTKLEEINYWVEMAKGVLLARNVVNQSPSLATPEWMEEQVRSLFSTVDTVKISSIVGQELVDKHYGCLYAVGKGAISPPRLVTIHYKGNSASEEVELALVGKGVTFDSGGLNLKSANIETMNLDKSGACNVLGAMHCICELKLPLNVVGCLALAENMIGRECYKPSDVLTSFSGKTVEVTNTDAEGRLCLADALSHVQKYYKPKIVIDIATLTGACKVALGLDTGGLFSNDNELAKSILKCSSDVGETFWQLPLFPVHSEMIKGSIADLKNSAKIKYGGASAAAAFLKEFIENDTKWAHCDIAGPGKKSLSGTALALGTGFGTQTMVAFAKSLTTK